MATATKSKKKAPKQKGVSIQPLDDRVILRIDAAEEMSPGGIILPQGAQEQSQFATVVAVGPGAPWKEYVLEPDPAKAVDACQLLQPRYPMSVKKGDRVMIGRFAGSPLELEDEKYTIVREADILCIVEVS